MIHLCNAGENFQEKSQRDYFNENKYVIWIIYLWGMCAYMLYNIFTYAYMHNIFENYNRRKEFTKYNTENNVLKSYIYEPIKEI